ncbi:CHAP domain-containing protein [Lapidilactobacillus gannanensis]|uniref:CHAP domain-containing protein n=1 Tax=Lapidilactobacillus gannanensis TaxID=2486002 RepID=A0ABW4BIP0_9LACO|nr:CHAP domain-containing protein [Lapidilactobacillus gannanensis]
MKKIKKTLFLSATVMLLAGPALAQTGSVYADTVSDAKSAISSNQSAGDKLVSQLNDMQDKVVALQKKVTAKNQEIANVESDITSSQNRLDELVGEIKTSTIELNNRKTVLREQLVQLQKQSTNSVSGNVYVDFVLSSDNFTELLSRSVAVGKLNKANKDAMDAVQEAKNKLAGLKDEQSAKQDQLVADKNKLVSEKTALTAAQKDADNASQDLQKKIEDNQATLATLKVNLNTALTAQQKAANEAAQKQAAAEAAAAQAKAQTKTVNNSSNKAAETPTTNVVQNVNGGSTNNNGSGSSSNGGNSSHNGNAYAYGQCTWYAYERSGWAGSYWGNGADWGNSARAAGYTVNHTPAVGAIVSFAGGQNIGGWTADPTYGHVAYVESVGNGTITISQGGMGFSNPGGRNYQTLSNVGAYTYIHPAN